MIHPIRQALGEVSRQLGFSAFGVASAHAPQGEGLSQWLARGAHADMEWMLRHEAPRLNPELVLENVRCVIMLSYEYPRHSQRQALGQIARYAQAEDYHKILAPKLADIDELLQTFGGHQRCFTDSGPVSERFFAQQAGLGWIGRHGLLVRRERGTYCVLASVLTDLDIPLDSPAKSYCGKCRRCLDACPTGALDGSSCDARRCLAYWTIEAKSAIPDEIAALAPLQLFGCDKCQEACPWNQRVEPSPIDPHMLMPRQLQSLRLEDLLEMTEEEFAHLFARSPLKRAGLAKLQARSRQIIGGLAEPHDAYAPN